MSLFQPGGGSSRPPGAQWLNPRPPGDTAVGRAVPNRRLRLGRLQVYLQWRDLWIGLYVSPRALCLCPLPTLVLRWQRRGWVNLGGRRLPPPAPSGCEVCHANPGYRHGPDCARVPLGWYTQPVVGRSR